MSIASAAWPAIESAVSAISPSTGRPGCSETMVSVASSSAGVAIGTTAALDPLRRNGASSASAPPSASAPVGVQEERLVALEQGEQIPSRQLLRPGQQCARGRVDALVVHVHRPRDQLDPALVGHPDHGGVDAEQRHDRLGEHIERRLQRQALGERAGDLVERVEPLGRLALRRERLLALAAQLLRALVEPCVLDQHRELRGERDEQRALVRAQRPRQPRVDGEHADRLVSDDERQRERGVDTRLAHLGARGLQALVRRPRRRPRRSLPPGASAAPRRAARRRSPRAAPRCLGSRRRPSGRPRGDRRRRGRRRAAPRHARSPCRACGRATAARSPRRRPTAARGFARARSRSRGRARTSGARARRGRRSWRVGRGLLVGRAAGRKPELERAERRLAELKRDRFPSRRRRRVPPASPAPRRSAARRPPARRPARSDRGCLRPRALPRAGATRAPLPLRRRAWPAGRRARPRPRRPRRRRARRRRRPGRRRSPGPTRARPRRGGPRARRDRPRASRRASPRRRTARRDERAPAFRSPRPRRAER